MNKKLFAASACRVCERFSSTRCGTLISVASEYDYAYVVMKHTWWVKDIFMLYIDVTKNNISI